MYEVLIADDEPTAVNLIQAIIDRKCESFEVCGIAFDGEEALEKIGENIPDVVITDIQMPVMNGLKLAEKMKEMYPDVLCVVVSGYQEFEYAKEAMRFGVMEYILKPIVPSELCGVLSRLEKGLKSKYYMQRNILMHKMVNDIAVECSELKKYFQAKRYYGAIVRLNGLPIRFGERNQKEIFSDIDEWMLTYGRDSQETLYLCPEELVCEDDYVEMMKRHIRKEQPGAAYVTTIICQKSVTVAELGEMVKGLYRTLDSIIIIGKNQTQILDDCRVYEQKHSDRDYSYLEELEYLAENQKYKRLQKETENLIQKWAKEEHPQIWLEGRIRQICYLLQRYGVGNENYRESEFLLDEMFSNAENMEQLSASVIDILFKDIKDNALARQKQSTEEYFQAIKRYIQVHMAEALNLQTVSREMGISQTYLSRLFRKYENSSFNNYLTSLRMEKAKELLLNDDKIFVKDVAEQVGYKDQFYFSRIFYSYTGVRPSEYVIEKE